jgi:hypothetical protein
MVREGYFKNFMGPCTLMAGIIKIRDDLNKQIKQ